jgi:hypothetical protein
VLMDFADVARQSDHETRITRPIIPLISQKQFSYILSPLYYPTNVLLPSVA